MNLCPIKRALLSVSDKTGLIDLARGLLEFDVELISTGGTHRALQEAGVHVRDVSSVTQFPEILDGRVKTLHPRIHAGILAVRGNTDHVTTLQQQDITPIDLVVCNLYPFEATCGRPDASHDEIVENIDVGGPSMIRAAAKNYQDVAVVTSPEQYVGLIASLREHKGALPLTLREQLAAAAFTCTAAYDHAISNYMVRRTNTDSFPPMLLLRFALRTPLRYGENPHQKAAFYFEPGYTSPCAATAETLHGKELSFNNILDLESALNLAKEFTAPASVVMKHSNPCGAATATTLVDAFRKAHAGDPISAFGGVLGFNRELDEATAREITEPNRFVECIIAPGYSEVAFKLLTTRPTWKKSVRLLRCQSLEIVPMQTTLDFRRIEGGLLAQTRDAGSADFANRRVVTKKAPTDKEMADLRFAWLVCKHVKSNAIVFAKDEMAVGVGAGQMSRVDSVHLAERKGGERSRGAVMASDAFFPFRDNIDAAAQAGITAVIQPGGSMRDDESIAACDEHGMSMVLTGVRHFRH